MAVTEPLHADAQFKWETWGMLKEGISFLLSVKTTALKHPEASVTLTV
jgi:hypothetical protein